KTRRSKTERLPHIWLICFCIGVVLAVSYTEKTAWSGSETSAQNISAQASTTTALQDSKDSEAREALKAGDVYFDSSEYAQAQSRRHRLLVLLEPRCPLNPVG